MAIEILTAQPTSAYGNDSGRSRKFNAYFKNRTFICFYISTTLLIMSAFHGQLAEAGFDYQDALHKSILFHEAQRSGKLPPNQRVTWRGDSALADGLLENVDLSGGYYDAGDNVKFGFPMAFTITMLSWGAVQYGSQLNRAGELQNVQAAIKWGTDYFLKAQSGSTKLYVQVGDPPTDHNCWERPEDMDTPRTVQHVDASSPGSEVVAETAAAMAAASIAFKNSNAAYSTQLLNAAIELFAFADEYRGTFTGACPFYCPYSGYWDELLWASGWLYKATGASKYLQYIISYQDQIGGSSEFSWENKAAGVHVLFSKFYFAGQSSLSRSKSLADSYICSILPGSPARSVGTTPGGLIYIREGANTQYGLNAAFLLSVYVEYMAEADTNQVYCGSQKFSASNIISFANSQVNYILGANPLEMSYMTGFGSKYPQQSHHRGASIDSVHILTQKVGCSEGFNFWFNRAAPNPNVLIGAIAGGPDSEDGFSDLRSSSVYTEPCTYINAPMVALTARMLYA